MENRRRKLQSYLRQVMNMLLQVDTDLARGVSKEILLRKMPFFSDLGGKEKKGKGKVQEQLQTNNSDIPSSSGVYMGW